MLTLAAYQQPLLKHAKLNFSFFYMRIWYSSWLRRTHTYKSSENAQLFMSCKSVEKYYLFRIHVFANESFWAKNNIIRLLYTWRFSIVLNVRTVIYGSSISLRHAALEDVFKFASNCMWFSLGITNLIIKWINKILNSCYFWHFTSSSEKYKRILTLIFKMIIVPNYSPPTYRKPYSHIRLYTHAE